MRSHRLLFLLLTLLLALLTPAAEPLDTHWQFLSDVNGEQTLTKIQAAAPSEWIDIPGAMVGFSFTDGTIWLKTEFIPDDDGGHILELANPRLDYVAFYVCYPDGHIESQRAGFGMSQTQTKLGPYHHQVFEFDALQKGQKIRLYVQLSATRAVNVWPQLFDDTQFYQHSFGERLILGGYFGLFLALSLYSLMAWYTTRDRDFLNFLFVMSTSGALQLHLQGVWYELFLDDFPWLASFSNTLFPALAFAAFSLFGRTFLNLREQHQSGDRALAIGFWASLSLLPAYFVIGARAAVYLSSAFGAILGAVAVAVGFISWRGGNRPARFYLLAQGILISGGLVHVLQSFNLFPLSPASAYIFPLSAALNVLLLTLALAYKMHVLQNERESAQREILTTKLHMLEVLRESEAQLESRVRERTVQLESALLLQQLQGEELQSNNAKLSAFNEERSAFLGIAAHDLKNPTSAIMGYADLLQERWTSWDEEKKLKRIASIRQLAQHIYEIIRNLLDINAIESGRYVLNPANQDLNERLQLVAEVYHDRLEVKHMRLDLQMSEKLQVYIDKSALHQVLDNLLSNAVKYSPLGSAVHILAGEEDGRISVRVRDEGPGISAEDQSKLFRKFTRLSARPTGGEHSTGLGLSIVKHIVEASGGSIHCESRLGEGATFVLDLPQAREVL